MYLCDSYSILNTDNSAKKHKKKLLRNSCIINYFETVQFASKASASPDLDFILFGSYCNGRPQIFYIDRESYKHIGESTDLENADLHLSPLNKNEITVYGKF